MKIVSKSCYIVFCTCKDVNGAKNHFGITDYTTDDKVAVCPDCNKVWDKKYWIKGRVTNMKGFN